MITGLTIMTNPDYRQDPARECIKQALEIFDQVIVIYGRKEDKTEVLDDLFEYGSRIVYHFMPWPQPDWSFDELPKHLNKGLEIAHELKADWVVRFDADTFFTPKKLFWITSVKELTSIVSIFFPRTRLSIRFLRSLSLT